MRAEHNEKSCAVRCKIVKRFYIITYSYTYCIYSSTPRKDNSFFFSCHRMSPHHFWKLYRYYTAITSMAERVTQFIYIFNILPTNSCVASCTSSFIPYNTYTYARGFNDMSSTNYPKYFERIILHEFSLFNDLQTCTFARNEKVLYEKLCNISTIDPI